MIRSFLPLLLALALAPLLQAGAPLLPPQPDGVFYLPPDSAEIVRPMGQQEEPVARGAGLLRREHGHIVSWAGAAERPRWRIAVSKAGRYRVIVNRASGPGGECTCGIVVRGAQETRASRALETTGGWEVCVPGELGELALPAGELTVEFLPQTWRAMAFRMDLADVRLIPLEAALAAEAKARVALEKLADPQLAALQAQLLAAKAERSVQDQRARQKDFSALTDCRQFAEYEEAPARRDAAQRTMERLERTVRTLRLAKAAAAPAGVGEYVQAATLVRDAETKAYPPGPFAEQPARTTLFSPEAMHRLPPQAIDAALPVVPLAVQPPPDAAERARRFAQRDDAAGLAALARELRHALMPGTPGLEAFEQARAAGKNREALEAYRAWFFAKLAQPEKHGALDENLLFDLFRERGPGSVVCQPSPVALARNLAGAALVQTGGELLEVKVGEPGAVSWVPWGLSLPEGTPVLRTLAGLDKETQRRLEFYRCLHSLLADRAEYYRGGFFPALLYSYATGGPAAHLQRWCAYADDWCLNARRDQDAFPVKTIFATELMPQQVRCTLLQLRVMLDLRPELARDFPAPALARLVLKLVSDFTPYSFRARRAEMANWGIMALGDQLHLCQLLSEFRAMEYFNRETWRLWQINFLHHRTPDGENFEAWDAGHNLVDLEYALKSVPFAKLPPEADALEQRQFEDHLKANERDLLVHLSPQGQIWPSWGRKMEVSRDLPGRFFSERVPGRTFLDLIQDEPEARARIETLLGAEKAARPAQTSDVAPYQAMSYLRESWQPEAEYLILQNSVARSQTLADCPRTKYELSQGGRILFSAHALAVDRRPDNRFYGAVRTGGKTDYCGRAGEETVPMRFLTSDRFDFSEALQDSPWALPRTSERGEPEYGLYRTAPGDAEDAGAIKDVRDRRQVISVKGEGLYLIRDQIVSGGAQAHEYAQFFSTPLHLPEIGLADRLRLLSAAGRDCLELNAEKRSVRSMNPACTNISAHFFGPEKLAFAGALDRRGEFAELKWPALQNLQQALAAAKTPALALASQQSVPLSVRWSGAGAQTLLTVLATRPAAAELSGIGEGDLRLIETLPGGAGVTGCHALTPGGAEVWYQSAREPAELTCGPLKAAAEALLVVRRKDGKIGGLVLGCRRLKGLTKIEAPDFEFEVSPQAAVTVRQPLRLPIETVRFAPEQSVFTDTLAVSFSLPPAASQGIEMHYTLDGSDPGLESPRYRGPITLKETTLVKVRPFRIGLRATPWNIPGTDAGKTVSAIFRREAPQPAVPEAAPKPGLAVEYFEGAWPSLFTWAGYPGALEAKAKGETRGLLVPEEIAALRRTDGAFALSYAGQVRIPAPGVYAFYAPAPLYASTADAGYDLRLFIDEREWRPSPAMHAENIWHVALAAGPHRLRVAYVDYRGRKFCDEYWMAWQPEEMWKGTPVLELSGPGLSRQALPSAWLYH